MNQKLTAMKGLLGFFVILICCCIICNAQQVVTSGGYTEKKDLSVEWVLGGKLFGYNEFVLNEFPVVKSSLIQDSVPEITIKVYPTYTRDFVTVEISTVKNPFYFVDLYNSIGEKVIERINMKQPLIQVNLSNLISAIYFLKITTASPEQLIHIEKIVKL